MVNFLRLALNVKREFLILATKEKGTVSVETSLIFIPLIFTILFMFEICRMIYISSSLDLAVAEASRYAAISTMKEENYQSIFYKKLKNEIPFWSLLTKNEDIYVDVSYCYAINDIITNGCDNHANGKTLAIYKLGYKYTHIFSMLPATSFNSYLQRTIIYVQEHQRDNN